MLLINNNNNNDNLIIIINHITRPTQLSLIQYSSRRRRTNKTAVIGGQDVEVEIDESKFGKRKYNIGRHVEGHWVFGGVERITGECFLVEVEHRDATTLLPRIQQHICPGSIIYSDEWWRAYNQINASTGMTHMTVNHFVDPATGAHTQGVEAMWSSCKRVLREERTMQSKLFDTYLPDYMWR